MADTIQQARELAAGIAKDPSAFQVAKRLGGLIMLAVEELVAIRQLLEQQKQP